MRPLHHGDLVSAACLIYSYPVAQRAARLDSLFDLAHAADLYRKRFGRGHRTWGNGSVMAMARRSIVGPEPPLEDLEYCQCLAQVLRAWTEWKSEKSSENK